MTSRTLTKTASLEATFWEQRWPVEARLARWASWVAIGLGIVGFVVDCRMVGLGATFFALGALRLVSIVGFVMVLVLAQRPRRSRYVGLASVVAFLGLSALQAALPVLKPTAAGIQGASQLVIFVLWCLFYPGRVRSKVIVGLVGWAAWAGVAVHQHIYAGYSHLTDFYTVLPGQLAACVLAPLGVRFIEQMQLRESLASQRQTLLNMQLELEVKKRAKREEELSAAKQAAEEASRAKSVFLARMSHELRTPLGGVLGAAGAFDEADLSAEHRALLEMMRSSGRVLRTVVDEVLDLERIETGKLALQSRPVDIRVVVDQAVDVCSMSAYAKGLEIVGIVDAGVPARVQLDGDRLGQVLVNLLGNGVKFTASGQVRVEVRWGDPDDQDDEDDGPMLELCIIDTGRGIPADRLGAVFDPYDRGDPDMERRFGGTGLGLAISRRIVQAMGGRIRAESEVDRGSVFSVHLPAPPLDLPGDAVGDPIGDDVGDDIAAAIGDGLSLDGLVLVSGEESTRSGVVSAGAFYGVRVVTASSLVEGLALWRTAGAAAPLVVDADGVGESLGAELVVPMGDVAPRILAVRPLDLATVRQSGLGAQFSAVTTKPVTLRRIRQAVVELAQGQPTVGEDPETRALRVLVVDDDLVSRKIAQSLIRRLGHEVDVAQDGTSALEAAGLHTYDVFVIDLHMPDMMGSELAGVLRERLGEGPYLLALTAAARHEDRQRCLDAGMHDFLTKPVDVGSLRVAFERIAEHGLSQKATTAGPDSPGTP